MSRWLLVVTAGCASVSPPTPSQTQTPASATSSSTAPAVTPQPTSAAAAQTSGTWVELPDVQRRLRCEADPAKVMFSTKNPPTATVRCGDNIIAIAKLSSTSLDNAIAEVHASLRTLQSRQRSETRSATTYRIDHENTNGWRKTNHWIDQVMQIDGSFYVCQASGMGDSDRNGDPAVAERGAAVCKTLQ